MRVLGIDPSLTACGLAVINQEARLFTLTHKSKATGIGRMRDVREAVRGATDDIDLAVMEGPAYNAKGGMSHERAGLWWFIYDMLDRAEIPIAVAAASSSISKFATGNGRAGKDAVLVAAVRRLPDFDGDNNCADAAWLACMGAAHLGRPLVDLPATHLAALKGVAWPQLPGDET